MRCKKCKSKFIVKYFNQKYCMIEDACIIAFKDEICTKHRKVEKAKLKDAVEPLSYYFNKLQDEINAIARIIDKDLLCLATGKKTTIIHGGHVLSRGSTPFLRFNLHNIHRQSGQSNHFQSDDLKLRAGLINEYGQDYFDYLESNKGGVLNLSKEDTKELIIKAREFKKWVSVQNRSTAIDRKKLRNLGNSHIMGVKYELYKIKI